MSRERIVEKAIELMRRQGLAAVTLRRIATELGVSAPTLYWYIADKRQLLDSVAEHLMRRGSSQVLDRPAEGQLWWEWLTERSKALFENMISVQDAPQVIAGNRPTFDQLASIDIAIGELVEAGFSAAEAQQVFFVLGGYIGGMALEWQSEAARERDDVDDQEIHQAVGDSERFPNLAAAVRDGVHVAPMETFTFGLDLLISGLCNRHAERAGG